MLDALVELSRRYGSDPEWVLAGGGNTSYKDAATLYVKASGRALGGIDAAGFCAVDRGRLDAIWRREYPRGSEEREAAVLADLMASRLEGEVKRPSVETLMHGFFPQAYVVHTHPALANGLTCGRDGEAAFRRLFGDEAIWVPFVDPGYVLANEVRMAVEAFASRSGRRPAILFMENHGLLVAGEDPAEIDRLSKLVVSRISSIVARRPDHAAAPVDAGALARAAGSIASLAPPGSRILHRADVEILSRCGSPSAFAPLASAFSPDHIVYAGHEFLYSEDPGVLGGSWADYAARNGTPPRIVAVAGIGAFSVAASRAAAETAMLLFVDACKIAAYAESFGGYKHMTRAQIDFIRGWEVEKYRSSVASGP